MARTKKYKSRKIKRKTKRSRKSRKSRKGKKKTKRRSGRKTRKSRKRKSRKRKSRKRKSRKKTRKYRIVDDNLIQEDRLNLCFVRTLPVENDTSYEPINWDINYIEGLINYLYRLKQNYDESIDFKKTYIKHGGWGVTYKYELVVIGNNNNIPEEEYEKLRSYLPFKFVVKSCKSGNRPENFRNDDSSWDKCEPQRINTKFPEARLTNIYEFINDCQSDLGPVSPCIIQMIKHPLYDDKVIMPLADGDLSDLLKENVLTHYSLLDIMHTIAHSVLCLNKKGYYYFDIKLENILYKRISKSIIHIMFADVGSLFQPGDKGIIFTPGINSVPLLWEPDIYNYWDNRMQSYSIIRMCASLAEKIASQTKDYSILDRLPTEIDGLKSILIKIPTLEKLITIIKKTHKNNYDNHDKNIYDKSYSQSDIKNLENARTELKRIKEEELREREEFFSAHSTISSDDDDEFFSATSTQ